MNVETLNGGGDAAAIENAENAETAAAADETDLGAVWDKLQRDNGAERGQDGKFSSGAEEDGETETGENDDAEASKAPPQEGEGKEEETDGDGSSTLTEQSVPLPANWNGMDEDWKKIPPDVQAKIAARDGEIHARMSEQGRQLGVYKPVYDAVDQNKDLLEGRTMPDGRPVTPAFAVQFLLEAQRRIDQNPVGALVEMAERFGMRDHLRAALNGQLNYQKISPVTPAAGQQSSMTAAEVENIVKNQLSEDNQVKAANEEISRLSKDKPLYSEIAEDDMVFFIHKARSGLGDAASNEAVFNAAYDMAVNADPALRAKAAAAKKTTEAAAADPKRTADAKRANSINVKSTSSGKARELTEDELLAATYDDLQSKG